MDPLQKSPRNDLSIVALVCLPELREQIFHHQYWEMISPVQVTIFTTFNRRHGGKDTFGNQTSVGQLPFCWVILKHSREQPGTVCRRKIKMPIRVAGILIFKKELVE